LDFIGRAFEKADIEFIDENGSGAGVRLPKPGESHVLTHAWNRRNAPNFRIA
jgi:hypothetical protein